MSLKDFWNYKFFDKRQNKQEIRVQEVIKPRDYYFFSKPIESEKKEYILIEPYTTFKVHDLANMFPFNITPALIESKIQHAIAAKQSFLNRLNGQVVLLFIMVMMGTAIAGIIIWKFMKQGDITVTVQAAPGIQSAAYVTNLTG